MMEPYTVFAIVCTLLTVSYIFFRMNYIHNMETPGALLGGLLLLGGFFPEEPVLPYLKNNVPIFMVACVIITELIIYFQSRKQNEPNTEN